MTPYLTLAAVAMVGVLTGGAYYQGRKDGENKIIAQQAREEQIALKAADAAASAAAQAIARIKVQHRTITQEVQREVIQVPAYRECKHDPSVLRNINAAIAGQPASAPDRSKLPGTDAPDR